MLKVPLEMPVPAAVPSVQIIRAVLREYHAATHTAQVEPVLGPASLVGEIPVLMSCRPDLLTTGREVAVLTWSDVGGLVLGPHGAVPGDPPSADDADKVDGIHASATPTANKLLALNASSKLPASITGDADTVDSIHAAATPTASKLLAMDANAKFPAHTVAGTLTVDSCLKLHGRFETFRGYKTLADNVATAIFKVEFVTNGAASLILDLVLGTTCATGYVCQIERWALALRWYAGSTIGSAVSLIKRVDAGSYTAGFSDVGNAVVTIASVAANRRFTISVQADHTGAWGDGVPTCTYMVQLLHIGDPPIFTAL